MHTKHSLFSSAYHFYVFSSAVMGWSDFYFFFLPLTSHFLLKFGSLWNCLCAQATIFCMIYGPECNGSCLSSPDFIKHTYCTKHNPVQPQMTLQPPFTSCCLGQLLKICPPSFHRRDDLVVIEPKRWHMIPTANLVWCHTCHFLGSWKIIEACGS